MTDSEAGALEFPSSKSRKFTYFKPAKLRPTMYEDVTVDVQPDPERHLTQGWIYGFGDGPGGYPAGVDGGEVVQLARVPRSQRGVEPDHLPQQRGRGADQWRARPAAGAPGIGGAACR